MTLTSVFSALRRRARFAAPSGLAPSTATLADVVTSPRYAALERLYIEACHDLHRYGRLAEHLRAELSDVQAEREALDLIAKAAKVSRRRDASPSGDPSQSTPVVGPSSMAELIDSVGGFSYPEVSLPETPTGEIALRRSFAVLTARLRATWTDLARTRREVADLYSRVQQTREAAQGLVSAFLGAVPPVAGRPATTQAVLPLSLQEGLTLRLRPNQIVGACIAFLSFSVLIGLLIVNSEAVAGHRLTPPSGPPAASTGSAR
jgi:hypothetical protein